MAISKLNGYTDIEGFQYVFDAGDLSTTKQSIIDLPANVTLVDAVLLSGSATGNVVTVEALDSSNTVVATPVTGDGSLAALAVKTVDQYVNIGVPTRLAVSADVAGTSGVNITLVITFLVNNKQEYTTK